MRFIGLLFLTLALLSNCKNKVDNDIIIPANDLFEKGEQQLESKQYKEAAETFSRLYFQHPGSDLTPKAEIKEAYSYYLAKEYEDAIDVIENFMHLHPLNEEIEYAYYLRAISKYMLVPDVHHDQAKTREAKQAIEEVNNRFPRGQYRDDLDKKLVLVNDHLAGEEMMVGRYYLKLKNAVAAINRFKIVAEEYQMTNHIEEALGRLVEAYLLLGLKNEAVKYAAVLQQNYPASFWCKSSLALLGKSK